MFFSQVKIAILLHIHYNKNNEWKIKIYLQRLKTFQQVISNRYIVLNMDQNRNQEK